MERKINGTFALIRSIDTLMRKKVPSEKRVVYARIVESKLPTGTYKTDEEEKGITAIACTIPRQNLNVSVPWSNGYSFDLFHTVASIIQFHDESGYDFPNYLFPVDLINEYTQKILQLPNNSTLTQQFQIALELFDYMPIGTVYLLAIASRVNCRGLDHNKDSNLRNEEAIKLWYEKVNRFDFISEKSDWGGNLYYFWTHFFANLYLLTLDKEGLKLAKIFNRQLFNNGTKYMSLVRKLFVNQPQMSNYDKSSNFGRKLGGIVFDLLNN